MLSLIIPAYNESQNIARVLDVVTQMNDFHEIIVVDDGSMDHTYQVASSYPVRVIRLEQNRGKGAAIAEGLKAAQCPFLVLLDADLIGLTPEHIRRLIRPVLEGEAVMTMGLFANGRFATDLAQKMTPSITGQRAFRRDVLEGLPQLEETRFGVDFVLTRHVKRLNLPVKTVFLDDVTQQIKEEKLGFSRGFVARLKMYWEILRVLVR
ncbi:glycosyl transferase [Collibacillus ludicampi]|jgi:glycosyltransferase involved in cell wall biosynthesis|uniref:Glucosyl-3-phosphoglycerate synthase n=1 Tax=Collibacillus ludicampi TaxID=2771369 RepID=A0AAV4LJ95_9BACL|nr:glycosyltransferase family 2 protein [Collibacillus ludicampi]GIM47836.1 glycosyl transferase [Collibacillus ludicampi]